MTHARRVCMQMAVAHMSTARLTNHDAGSVAFWTQIDACTASAATSAADASIRSAPMIIDALVGHAASANVAMTVAT